MNSGKPIPVKELIANSTPDSLSVEEMNLLWENKKTVRSPCLGDVGHSSHEILHPLVPEAPRNRQDAQDPIPQHEATRGVDPLLFRRVLRLVVVG